jgi:hypothetical protein
VIRSHLNYKFTSFDTRPDTALNWHHSNSCQDPHSPISNPIHKLHPRCMHAARSRGRARPELLLPISTIHADPTKCRFSWTKYYIVEFIWSVCGLNELGLKRCIRTPIGWKGVFALIQARDIPIYMDWCYVSGCEK